MGNQNIPSYGFASLMTSGVYYPFSSTSSSGYYLQRFGNENVRWESRIGFGIDF